MDGHAQNTSHHDVPNASAGRRRDLGLLALLLVLALGVRGWLMVHTEVLARDSIGFIRYALEFETDDWHQVLRNNHQHPGYPLTILAVSAPVRACMDAPDADKMAFSAQLASNLAALLLVIPMFYLGKVLFHRAAGFGAAALFQCLPICAHILSDGLSESLFLLLACTALVFAVLAVDGHSPWWFSLCGVFSGLAYLTRPEGLLVVVATLAVLMGLQRSQKYCRSWRQVAVCGGVLTLTALLIASPYVLVTHGLSNKPSTRQLFGGHLPELNVPNPAGPQTQVATGRPLLASSLAVTLNPNDTWTKRIFKAVWGLGTELVKCFYYGGWLPALVGMWWFRRRPWVVPGMWVLLTLCGLLALVLCRLAAGVGYVSDRHLMLLVVCGCFAGAAAAWELPARLAAWYRRQPWIGSAFAPVPHSRTSAGLAGLLLAAMVASGIPKTLETLHGNRAGHHAAGLWLARNASAADSIEDEHCWAHYYSGHFFVERGPIIKPAGYHPVRYVVIGRRDRDLTLTWNRQPSVPEDKLRADGGHIVFHWPAHGSVAEAAVVVYAVRVPRRQ
jgi:hypothetical protein